MEKLNQTPNQKPSYHIAYKQDDEVVQICNDVPQIEVAVKIALHLHEVSNTPHIIHVIHDDIIDVTFIRYGNSK